MVNYVMEMERVSQLYFYERVLATAGFWLVAGLDEAGRGPLAGPVMAAAVILRPGTFLSGLDDSKKVNPGRRSELAAQIKERAIAWQVAAVSPQDIDRYNILQATRMAMETALRMLSPPPQFLLVDYLRLPSVDCPQFGLVGGDGVSASVAAASILAKVQRDEVMLEMDDLYPEYGFRRHKGYPTREHVAALRRYGPSPIHRKSFKNVLSC